MILNLLINLSFVDLVSAGTVAHPVFGAVFIEGFMKPNDHPVFSGSENFDGAPWWRQNLVPAHRFRRARGTLLSSKISAGGFLSAHAFRSGQSMLCLFVGTRVARWPLQATCQRALFDCYVVVAFLCLLCGARGVVFVMFVLSFPHGSCAICCCIHVCVGFVVFVNSQSGFCF